MMLLWVPVSLLAIVATLTLATGLEERCARVAVRLTVRSRRASPELCESITATELAPVLTAHGLNR